MRKVLPKIFRQSGPGEGNKRYGSQPYEVQMDLEPHAVSHALVKRTLVALKACKVLRLSSLSPR